MNPLTPRDVIAHSTQVPWPSNLQIEQDLLLCHCMVALFNDRFLQGQIAMRGGTLLHKAHLAPAARYSEDIDLVVYGDRPEDHIAKAIRRVLSPLFGRPTDSLWGTIKLALRNANKPSRVLRLTYRIPSVSVTGKTLDVVVEANVTERTPYRAITSIPFQFQFRETPVQAVLTGYDLHEMLGTKMRALFQRKRGRDLFDLHWALVHAEPAVNVAMVIDSFLHYLRQEGTVARRDEFIAILDSHLSDRGFCREMVPLLRTGLKYDPQVAGQNVKANLLALLPA